MFQGWGDFSFVSLASKLKKQKRRLYFSHVFHKKLTVIDSGKRDQMTFTDVASCHDATWS